MSIAKDHIAIEDDLSLEENYGRSGAFFIHTLGHSRSGVN
jgi:hypothetical protein